METETGQARIKNELFRIAVSQVITFSVSVDCHE